MTWLTVGSTPTDENSDTYVVTGAPAGGSVEATARIYLYEVDQGDGTLVGSPVQEITAPDPTLATNFGAAMLAVDVLDCFPTPGSPGHWDGCGQELLVSAAPSSVHPGTVYLFVRDGAPGANGVLRHQLTFQQPTWVLGRLGPYNGDEFGKAFAAPRRVLDPDLPYVVAPDHPPYVLILQGPTYRDNGTGPAPVSSDFWMLEVDPSNPADPFPNAGSFSLTTGSGPPYTDVAAGDWNHDGLADIAVSTSGEGFGVTGSVNIWLGTNDATTWGGGPPGYLFHPGLHQVTLLGTPNLYATFVYEDQLGASMTSGWIHVDDAGTPDDLSDDSPREALIVGAPRLGTGSPGGGAVCEVRFQDNHFNNWADEIAPSGVWDPAEVCILDTHVSAASGDRFGAALASGNLVAEDRLSDDKSTEARRWEVAVGSPGFGSSAGDVTVIGADGGGLSEAFATLESSLGPQAGAQFGSAVAVGVGQREVAKRWGIPGRLSQWSDVAVGEPRRDLGAVLDRGRFTISEARATPPCEEGHGYWGVTTSGSRHAQILVCTTHNGNFLRIRFLEPFPITIEDALHNTCVASSTATDSGDSGTPETAWLDDHIPSGSVIEVPWGWSCGSGSATTAVANSEQLLSRIAEDHGHPGKTVTGEDLGVTVTWFDHGTATPVDDELKLELDISAFHLAGKFGMDNSCNVTPIPLFQRVDLQCEDDP